MISGVRVWEVLQLERVAISPRVRTGGALEPIRWITIVVQGNQTRGIIGTMPRLLRV